MKFQRAIAKFILKFKLSLKEIRTRCSFARLFNTLSILIRIVIIGILTESIKCMKLRMN